MWPASLISQWCAWRPPATQSDIWAALGMLGDHAWGHESCGCLGAVLGMVRMHVGCSQCSHVAAWMSSYSMPKDSCATACTSAMGQASCRSPLSSEGSTVQTSCASSQAWENFHAARAPLVTLACVSWAGPALFLARWLCSLAYPYGHQWCLSGSFQGSAQWLMLSASAACLWNQKEIWNWLRAKQPHL